MDVVSNLCFCILWFLVDTVTMGSKNVTVKRDLTSLDDHARLVECRLLSNSTLLTTRIAYKSTQQIDGGRLLQEIMESNCSRLGGDQLEVRWNSEEQQTRTGPGADREREQCRIKAQLDLKLLQWTNGTEVDGGLGWIVMDATLLLDIYSPAHTQEAIEQNRTRAKVPSNGQGFTLRVYKCTTIRQMAGQFEEVDDRQVANETYCSGSIDWRQIKVQFHIEYRTEANFSSSPIPWSNYEMMCDPAKEQTTDAAKNDRKMEPNPSTIYVATTFGVLVLCIIIVYFVVKNRRQGASYATMSDD